MEEFLEKINKVRLSESELALVVSEGLVKYKQIESDISDCTHMLELLPLNGAQMLKVTAKLKKLLKQRRALKPLVQYSSDKNNPNTITLKKYSSSNIVLKNHNEAITRYTKEAEQSYVRLFK